MIHTLTPYPTMKDSGVPWLGQVPEHWDVTRSKWLFASSKELARPDDVQLSATQAYGVIPQEEYERLSGARVVKISMHLDKRKHVEKDDFIISMRSFQGGLERAWASGAIRSSYVVLKPGSSVNVGFFSYLLKSHNYIRALQVTGGFIRDGQDLTESNFREVDLPLVPPDEQAAIVRYLDYADRRIRRTIAAKQRLIKLLQEQKQVIIHQAVTRGLDPDVKLKPSGVEWLGDVPEGWEVKRLKAVCMDIVDCKNRTPEQVDEGEFTVVRTTNIRGGEFRPEGSFQTDLKNFTIWTQRGAPQEGDVFFTREAPVGEACLVPSGGGLCMGQRMMYFSSVGDNFTSSPSWGAKRTGEQIQESHESFGFPAQGIHEMLSTVPHQTDRLSTMLQDGDGLGLAEPDPQSQTEHPGQGHESEEPS